MNMCPTIWVQTSSKKKCPQCATKGASFIAGYYHAARWGRLFDFCDVCAKAGGFRKLLDRYSNLGARKFGISARSSYRIPQWIYDLVE